jgi:hypothetical protein
MPRCGRYAAINAMNSRSCGIAADMPGRLAPITGSEPV